MISVFHKDKFQQLVLMLRDYDIANTYLYFLKNYSAIKGLFYISIHVYEILSIAKQLHTSRVKSHSTFTRLQTQIYNTGFSENHSQITVMYTVNFAAADVQQRSHSVSNYS